MLSLRSMRRTLRHSIGRERLMTRTHRSVAVTLCSIVVLALATPASATYPGANGEIARYGGKLVPSTLRSIGADGTVGRVLARPGVGLPDAEWSPDGTQVAMILGKEPNRIVMLDLLTDVRSLVIRSDDVPDARLIHSLGISPAGDAIVFCAVLRGAINTALYTVGVDGSALARISGLRQECSPDWGPTDRIAAERYGSGSKIVTMDPDGSNPVVVIRGRDADRAAVFSSPSWSPVVASTSSNEIRPDLWIVDADGANLIALTDTVRRTEFAPIFSPDGTRIAFLRANARDGYPQSDIFTMAVDGSDLQRVTDTPNRHEYPRSWRALST
jgi:Tol biopolymer transport system component